MIVIRIRILIKCLQRNKYLLSLSSLRIQSYTLQILNNTFSLNFSTLDVIIFTIFKFAYLINIPHITITPPKMDPYTKSTPTNDLKPVFSYYHDAEILSYFFKPILELLRFHNKNRNKVFIIEFLYSSPKIKTMRLKSKPHGP